MEKISKSKNNAASDIIKGKLDRKKLGSSSWNSAAGSKEFGFKLFSYCMH